MFLGVMYIAYSMGEKSQCGDLLMINYVLYLRTDSHFSTILTIKIPHKGPWLKAPLRSCMARRFKCSSLSVSAALNGHELWLTWKALGVSAACLAPMLTVSKYPDMAEGE